MISVYLNNFKNRASKAILAVALILSLFSGFTTSKSPVTNTKTQSEWVIREKGKSHLTSAFKLNVTQSLTSFSDHSQVTYQLFQNRRIEIIFKANQNLFSMIDLSFQFHSNSQPHDSDEDLPLV